MTLRALARRPEDLPTSAGYGGLVLFLIGGLGGIEVLSNSQLGFAYAPVLARMAVTACLGVGGGLLVALICAIAGPVPVHHSAPPADEVGQRPEPGHHRAEADASEGSGGGQ